MVQLGHQPKLNFAVALQLTMSITWRQVRDGWHARISGRIGPAGPRRTAAAQT